ECNGADAIIADERLAHARAGADEDLKHAWWEMTIDDANTFHEGQWAIARRFHYNSVTGGDCGDEALKAEKNGRVPWRNQDGDAACTTPRPDRLIRIECNRLRPLVQILRDDLHEFDGTPDVDFGFAQGLAVFAREEVCKIWENLAEITGGV